MRPLWTIIKGGLAYFRYPEIRASWGGAFNGQQSRLQMFEALVADFEPELLIETGTYRGTTTRVLAGLVPRLLTIESNPRYFGFARMALLRYPNVRTLLGDSSTLVTRLAAKETPDARVMAYLDAHWWGSALPLRDEIVALCERFHEAIVVIDDFEVPGDEDYGFDDFGAGQSLDFDYIRDLVDAHDLLPAYPRTPAADETGMRRGCIVLARGEAAQRTLRTHAMLEIRERDGL